MTAILGPILIFIGGTALACRVLAAIAGGRVRRKRPADGAGGDVGGTSDSSDGWSLSDWFGHASSDGASDVSDGGGSDGDGGGGDGGGGDGGGGGDSGGGGDGGGGGGD